MKRKRGVNRRARNLSRNSMKRIDRLHPIVPKQYQEIRHKQTKLSAYSYVAFLVHVREKDMGFVAMILSAMATNKRLQAKIDSVYNKRN